MSSRELRGRLATLSAFDCYELWEGTVAPWESDLHRDALDDVPRHALLPPVVQPGGSRVGVPGRDLDVTQVDPGVEHGGDEGVAEHVRVHPIGGDSRDPGEGSQPAGGAVPWRPRSSDHLAVNKSDRTTTGTAMATSSEHLGNHQYRDSQDQPVEPPPRVGAPVLNVPRRGRVPTL